MDAEPRRRGDLPKPVCQVGSSIATLLHNRQSKNSHLCCCCINIRAMRSAEMPIIPYESNIYAALNAGDQMIIINVSMLNNCWREVRRRARGEVRTRGGRQGASAPPRLCSIAYGLLGRDPVQPGHAAAHSAQSQMSVLAQDRGHLI